MLSILKKVKDAKFYFLSCHTYTAKTPKSSYHKVEHRVYKIPITGSDTPQYSVYCMSELQV